MPATFSNFLAGGEGSSRRRDVLAVSLGWPASSSPASIDPATLHPLRCFSDFLMVPPPPSSLGPGNRFLPLLQDGTFFHLPSRAARLKAPGLGSIANSFGILTYLPNHLHLTLPLIAGSPGGNVSHPLPPRFMTRKWNFQTELTVDKTLFRSLETNS